MFKKLVAILLLFALIGSNLSRYLVVASFKLNRRFIVENFCENKAKPQLQCNGRCFLAKKLKQADENEKKQTEKYELKSIDPCVLQHTIPIFNPLIADNTSIRLPVFYELIFSSRYISGIFKPPRLG